MSRRRCRRLFGVLLIIASLVVALIPTNDVIAETSKSKATDFEISGTTLVKYTGTASTVSVPDSIKTIGEEAFADNSTLVTLNLPKGLEKISYAAFSGCSSLKKVIIPDTVSEIGTAAFCNCTNLNEFVLGKETIKLGTGVFTGCPKLSTVSGNDFIVCEDGVLYDDEKETLYEVLQGAKYKKDVSSNDYYTLTDYTMPNSVTTIKPYAFYGCRNLNSINLSSNLKDIPAYAFSFCNGISSIKIPYSVNLIDMKSFENCINLGEVNIPQSVTFIHETAFDGCPKLKVDAPVGSYAYDWYTNFDNSDVNIIDNEDNESEEKTWRDELPVIEGLIGETVIVGRQAVFFIDNSNFSVNGEAIDIEDYSKIVEDMENVLQTETNGKGLSLPKFAVIDKKISGKAFYADGSLTEYDIADSIESIGDFAFARTALKEIVIPDSVTEIGYGAFYHADDLSKIVVPGTVTYIGPSAFNKTRMLENWMLYGSDDFLIMGDGILVAYRGKESSIVIPEGVKQIGAEAFMNHKGIIEVSLPDSLEIIREGAFSGCQNLRNFTGGTNLKIIEDRAFSGCPIASIRIIDSVEKIGLGAFDVSNTVLGSEYKNVVFHGDVLPASFYGTTTTRLTNSDYRVDSFEDVRLAIVKSENVNRVGTVLDRDVSGFSGLVCVIVDENNSYFNGTLKIIDCTLTKEEAERFEIPSSVYIYGKGYNFRGSELESCLEMARAGAYEDDTAADENYASFEGSNEAYIVKVVKDSNSNKAIRDAYTRIYGDTVPGNLSTYKISVVDPLTNVALTKFGKQKLKISVVLPDNMPTSNLHVICTDEDGQLEDLPFKVDNINETLYVSFDIFHTGDYGMYAFNSTAVSKYNLDESPDTGDYIHPKWFLCIGLLSIGLVLVLLKDRKTVA